MKTKKIDLRIYGSISMNPGDEFNAVQFSLNGEDALGIMWCLYGYFQDELQDDELDRIFENKFKEIYNK